MSNYPAGASSDPNAPFNQLDEVVCSECDTQLDEDFCSPNDYRISRKSIISIERFSYYSFVSDRYGKR